jgi:preprotein translocase subunit SecE
VESGGRKYDRPVRSRTAVVLYVLALVVVVVGADILFFRHHVVERLIANIGIVLVFAAFYMTFLKSR